MEVILTSVVAFVTTNIDDIFILVILFSNTRFTTTEVVIGQYAGISTLIVASVIGSFIGIIIGPAYIGLMGIIPIYIGLKAILKQPEEEEISERIDLNKSSAHPVINALSIAAVTIANGGDNISIYIPLLAIQTLPEKITMITIFLLLTGAWCVIAKYLVGRPVIKQSVERYGGKFVPAVFILLGLYILFENGTIALLFDQAT